MRRFVAYILDYLILAIIMRNANHVLLRLTSNAMFIAFLKVSLIYLFFLFNDVVFQGYSIGKKLMKMKIILKDADIWKYSVRHSLYKLGFTLIIWIALLIYLINNMKMPYDRRFYLECN